MHLSEKALLVHLGISQWTAKKLDRKASDQVAAANQATVAAGNYNKSLLPTYDKLEMVKTKTSEIRKKFYANTLPWGIEGMQILPSANYLSFTTEFRKEKGIWQGRVNDFIAGYDKAHRDAQRLLGSLYNASDYPLIQDLRAKFSIHMSWMPVPMDGDFRVDLADEERAAIASEAAQQVATGAEAAMKAVWERLYEKVTWLMDRLSDPKNTFHDQTYMDAKDTCDLLGKLNFTDDPNLEQMRMEVRNSLLNFHPNTLRNDPDVRRSTAVEARAISEKMKVFMGGM